MTALRATEKMIHRIIPITKKINIALAQVFLDGLALSPKAQINIMMIFTIGRHIRIEVIIHSPTDTV
jgi:hypothetical protein